MTASGVRAVPRGIDRGELVENAIPRYLFRDRNIDKEGWKC
jgi:hypothetical protein